LGCHTLTTPRFGDGRYCNKIAQLMNLEGVPGDTIVLMDTDVFVLDSLGSLARSDCISGKAVDCAKPSLQALKKIAAAAGIRPLPITIPTDSNRGRTLLGNCNGGVYMIPRIHLRRFRELWASLAEWLLENDQELKKENNQNHIDQVAFFLALHKGEFKFELLPSNANFFLHFEAPHHYLDPASPVMALHYHHRCVTEDGLIKPHCKLSPAAAIAVNKANALLGSKRYQPSANSEPSVPQR
jgi:hypothetical protein